MAQALRQEAQRINAMVNKLLDMARLQSGAVQLRLEWQPIEEVVGSALQAMQSVLVGRSIEIVLAPDLPLVQLDAVLIERVLCNLLENAAKYTPAGTSIKISAEAGERELLLGVADQGPGLPAGREEQLFDKFTRGEKESSTPGVGLGLAICRAIMQAHQGRIWAETAAGGGARFVLSLPLGTPPMLPDREDQSA